MSSIERQIQPDEAWMRSVRASLLERAASSLSSESALRVSPVRQFAKSFLPMGLLQALRGPVMATLSVLLVVMGGSVASVSAAEQSLPGDFLYSLKLATEQARLALTQKKEDKLKLKVEFATRRGEDLKQVASQDVPEKPERVAKAAEILKRDLKTVKEQLEDVKGTTSAEKVVEVAKLVDQKSNELVQTLQETKASLSFEGKSKIVDAQAAAADTSVKAIEVLVETHKESNSSVQETDLVQAMKDHTATVATVTGSSNLVSTSTALVVAATGTAQAVPLEKAVEQIKAATQQAFAAEKNDLAQAAASSSSALLPAGDATSTNPLAETTSSTLPAQNITSTAPTTSTSKPEVPSTTSPP